MKIQLSDVFSDVEQNPIEKLQPKNSAFIDNYICAFNNKDFFSIRHLFVDLLKKSYLELEHPKIKGLVTRGIFSSKKPGHHLILFSDRDCKNPWFLFQAMNFIDGIILPNENFLSRQNI